MTDEQLRAMLSRIRRAYKLMAFDSDGRTQRVYEMTTGFVVAKEADDAAVAILREEMDKCPKCGSNDTLACCCECGVYWGKDGIREPVKITAAIYDPADDPTQSFVATT